MIGQRDAEADRTAVVVLVDGSTYVAEAAWSEDGLVHAVNARVKGPTGRLHGEPADFIFPRDQVKRVRKPRVS